MKKILLSLLTIIASFLDSKGQIYCTPAPSSVDGDGITNVSIPTGVNNATTAEAGNYGDYSAQTATVYQGTSVPVNITYSTAYTYDTKIWIDFNDDFDFDDVGEEVYSGTSLSANPTVLAASFNLAIAAPLGVHRLRIGGLDSGPVTSCYTGSYGTFEDYSVDIQTMAACSGAPNAGTATSSNTLLCSSQNVNLSLSGSTSADGLTYEWQSSPDGSTWTSIATATAIATTQSVTVPTYYQCIVSCATNTSVSTVVFVDFLGATTYASVPFLEAFDNVWQNRCDNQNVPVAANWSSNPTTGNNSWRRQDAGATALWTGPTTATVAPIGTGCANFHSYYAPDKTTGDLDVYLNMGTTSNYEMSFYRFNTSGADSLEVWLSTNGGSSFTKRAGYNVATSWTKEILNFGAVNSASCIVRFHGISDYGNNDLAFDSLQVYTAVCATPPIAGVITGTNSTTTGSVNSYSISPAIGNIQWYSSSSANGPWSSIVGATSATQSITALGSGTVYYTVIASSLGCPNDTANTPIDVNVIFLGDNVCNAIPLTIGTSPLFSLLGATTQTGEVAPPGAGCNTNNSWCNNTLNNSMWFSFVAPASGYVTVQSPGFDSQLAIWKAAACSDLLSASTATLIAANDDDADYLTHGGVNYSSFVKAGCLTPGATYFIQLDSYGSALTSDTTRVIIMDMGSPLDASFIGLAANYCLPASSSSLTAVTAGGIFTINTSTTSVTSFSPSSVGTSTVTYAIYGCNTTSTTVVANTPNVIAIATQTLLCDDGSTGSSVLTASTTATSYLWSDGATTMTTAVTPTLTTTYSVTVTELGCSAGAIVTVNVSNCNGVKELVANGVAIYPNPTNGVLNISISSELAGNTSIEVYDAIGKLVIKEIVSTETTTINTSKLTDGIYVFKIMNNNKAIKIGKVVKQ